MALMLDGTIGTRMDTIIIGGGIGGLCAAIGLAARGVRVRLIERNDEVGGKLHRWCRDGFTFDTGPHVLTMPWAFDSALAPTGLRLTDIVDLVSLDVVCRYHLPGPDAGFLDAYSDPVLAAEEIERCFPGERDGFLKFLDYAARVSDATTEPFLKRDFGASVKGMPSREQWGQLGAFIGLKPWCSLRQVVESKFRDPTLRQIFELYALYSGSHPARVSGIFATVADVQWRQGTFYIPGGLYTLASALLNVALELGVSVETGVGVTEVLIKGGRACGIVTDKGMRLQADTVVCNADFFTASNTLIPAQIKGHWSEERLSGVDPSTSAFLLLLGVAGTYSSLAHHNCFLSEDPECEYSAIVRDGVPSETPTIGVACQSATDPGVAPEGASNLFVMTNPPALSHNFDWNVERDRYRDLVIAKLEANGLTDLGRRIRVEQVWTPLDLQSRYGAFRGAIYGQSSNGWKQGFLRPPNVSADIRGLYFVGGSTHPGGGMPLCALSGASVARTITGTS